MSWNDFVKDFRSHLIGSTEHVSDNLDELSAHARWERDATLDDPRTVTLDVEIAMVREDLRRAREMMWDARGLDRPYALARQTALRSIRTLRGLRFERAQLGGTQ